MTDAAQRRQPPPRFNTVIAANRWQKFRLAYQLIQLFGLMVRLRPDVVITTGAAPGYLAIRIGRLLKARTVWVDSIANAQELSLSGKRAGKHCDLWLTQWAHLAGSDDDVRGPMYQGSTL
jgi:UDP-N-acetylglucosamine:LPS N-acetylglucosamine transferase